MTNTWFVVKYRYIGKDRKTYKCALAKPIPQDEYADDLVSLIRYDTDICAMFPCSGREAAYAMAHECNNRYKELNMLATTENLTREAVTSA